MGEVDDWYAQLLSNGVMIPEPPKHNKIYGIYHFFFRDPDGYTLEIQAFKDPGWKGAPGMG
jgi:catechol 2,3-dioxygenase-like lactoylglutathione lyase family enzyme